MNLDGQCADVIRNVIAEAGDDHAALEVLSSNDVLDLPPVCRIVRRRIADEQANKIRESIAQLAHRADHELLAFPGLYVAHHPDDSCVARNTKLMPKLVGRACDTHLCGIEAVVYRG